MACNAMHLVRGCSTEALLQVRRNERLLVLVVVSPHEGITLPEMRPQAGALEDAQPIKDGLVSTVALHPRCAVDALEGLAALAGCWRMF